MTYPSFFWIIFGYAKTTLFSILHYDMTTTGLRQPLKIRGFGFWLTTTRHFVLE
jgi:hypothetical protein